MNKLIHIVTVAALFFTVSCSDDDNENGPSINIPDQYVFERNGASTVSFSGQSTRIAMAEELIAGMTNFESTEALLLEMYRNQTADGGDANPFASAELNASTKSIKTKTAASQDYFAANTTLGSQVKALMEQYIKGQVNDVFPNQATVATPGVAGQIADGTRTRYVNAWGLEYNQLLTKSLIGALMTDQMLNNYLSTSVLDEGENRNNNDNGVLLDSKNYTNMEHKWDEAYGYVYGLSADPANPNATIGADDHFLNDYVGTVNENPAFTGIAESIFNSFILGRIAIIQGDYTGRDQQANSIREKISKVIAARAVHYLAGGKAALPDDRTNTALYGSAFHELSEAYGFIYSLQFTRRPNTNEPYFTSAEVSGFLEALVSDGPNGLWNVEPATLDDIAETIAAKFGFTVAQAAL